MSDEPKPPRNGQEWWAGVPDKLAELSTLVPGIVVAALAGWVLLGAL